MVGKEKTSENDVVCSPTEVEDNFQIPIIKNDPETISAKEFENSVDSSKVWQLNLSILQMIYFMLLH